MRWPQALHYIKFSRSSIIIVSVVTLCIGMGFGGNPIYKVEGAGWDEMKRLSLVSMTGC